MKRYLIQEKISKYFCKRYTVIADDFKDLNLKLNENGNHNKPIKILGIETIPCYQCKKELNENEVDNPRGACSPCIRNGY